MPCALTIHRLRCEYSDDPLGVDSPAPRLSWEVRSTERAQSQSAWRVLVASSPALLRDGAADLWDSGRVASGQTAHVAYAGTPLTSRRLCHWIVRVWDRDGVAGDWSPPACWEMGMLDIGDWTGRWIGRNSDTAAAPAPMFRHEFSAAGVVTRARIFICGLGYHELSLNGAVVGDRLLDPGYTRYDRRALYAVHDVTALIRQGGNCLGVILGTGWYNVHAQAVWYFDRAPWRGAPRLLAQLHIEYADGRAETIASDERWRTATGPIVYDSIYGGESYDARLERPGWDTPGYDDALWQQTVMAKPPGGVLSAQRMPPIRVTGELRPVRITRPRPGIHVVDMGQNFAGHLRISLEGAAGTEVTIRYGEILAEDGTLVTTKTGEHMVKTDPPQRFQTDVYTCHGRGRETWEARFTYHGFQYAEISGWPGELSADNLVGRVHHTGFTPAGSFACSNAMLEKIHRASLWAYRSNNQGIPTDCPHREKNGWTGDAHLAAELGLLNFDAITYYEKWLDDLFDEQRDSGELPGIVPTSGWGYAWGNGPAWDSAYHLIAWYLYRYYGDPTALIRHYQRLKRYVDYLGMMSVDGIVSIGLGDWLPPRVETPAALTSTAYWFVDTRIVAETARLLGLTAEAERYSALASSIRDAFNRRFYHPGEGTYADGSQTALACALYQGLAEDAERPKVLAALADEVARRGHRIDCGILGAKYVPRALSAGGRADLAYRMAATDEWPGWGNMISRGATTLWEDWNGGNSLNHVMFGDIAAWMVETIAGISCDPEIPGFARVVIAPHPVGDITHASATYDSVRGAISSSWTKEGGVFTLVVTIPANVTATVRIPAASLDGVSEGSGPAVAAEGVEFAGTGDGRIEFRVGSGTYRFQTVGLVAG